MKRVLHIIWTANFGGIERVVFELAQEQTIGKHLKPAVLLLKAEGEYLSRFRKAGFKLYELNIQSAKFITFSEAKALGRIFSQYNILHFHFFNPWVFALGIYSKNPIIYSEHGNFAFGRNLNATDHILNPLRTFCINHFAKAVSYNSCFTREYAERVFRYQKGPKRKVVYNGTAIDNELVQALEISELQNCFVVGTISRLAGFKRIDRLLHAFAKCRQSKNLRLIIVGDGPLKDNLVKLSNQLGLSDRILFTGYLKQTKSAIMRMNLCVLPSQREPFGLVALEALQLGKPTYVFQDGGGLVEIIEPLGKKYVLRDEESLTERINIEFQKWEKGTKEEKSKELERKSRAAGFNILKMAEEFENLYLSLN